MTHEMVQAAISVCSVSRSVNMQDKVVIKVYIHSYIVMKSIRCHYYILEMILNF